MLQQCQHSHCAHLRGPPLPPAAAAGGWHVAQAHQRVASHHAKSTQATATKDGGCQGGQHPAVSAPVVCKLGG